MRVWTDASDSQLCITLNPEWPMIKSHSFGRDINKAEAEAILWAVASVSWHDLGEHALLEICTDSEVFVKHHNREYALKDAGLIALHTVIRDLCQDREVIFTYVPREENLAGHVLESLKRRK